MPANTSFTQFERISDQIRGAAALRLHAFFSGIGGALYVPVEATPGHILERLLGRKAFLDIVQAFKGETLHVNRLDLEPLKNAARVWALSSKNISRQTTAGLLGITPARVGQIIAQLNEEGFGGLEDSVLFATNPVDEVNSHV